MVQDCRDKGWYMVIPDRGGLQRLPGPICLEVPDTVGLMGIERKKAVQRLGEVSERFLLDMEEGGAEQEARREGVVAGHHYRQESVLVLVTRRAG